VYSIRQFLDKKGRDVWSVHQDAPVFDALKLMAEKRCGALVVLDDNGQLAGVISERDYARKVVLLRKTSIDTPVSEIMTADVITVGESDSLDQALSLMSSHNIRHLPVTEGKKLIGVLGIGELVHHKIEEAAQKIENKEQEVQQLTKYVSGSLAYR
jgi:CBS domain-containing protein